MNNFQKFFGHLRTVHKHRAMVRRLCFKCGLYWQGLTHDLSKYSPVEFWNGVKYFTGIASPHVGERKEKGYSDAWIHHHNRNKHHSFYWQDINSVNNKQCCVNIPKKYLVESICDRIAASKNYLQDRFLNSSPLEYYMSNRHQDILTEETRQNLEMWLNNVSIYGIEETLRKMKLWIKNK